MSLRKEALEAMNKELFELQKKHGYNLAAESYIDNGLIRARVTVVPRPSTVEEPTSDTTKNDGEA